MAKVRHFIKCERLGDFPKTYAVSSNNPKDLSVPLDRVYRFRFYERSVFTIDGVDSFGSRENESEWYYIGERLTLTEVKQQYPEHPLISEMEKAKCDAVRLSNGELLLLPRDAKIYTP